MARLHSTVKFNNAATVVTALERLPVQTIAGVEVFVTNSSAVGELSLSIRMLGLMSNWRDTAGARVGVDLGGLGRRDAIVDVFLGRHVGYWRCSCRLLCLCVAFPMTLSGPVKGDGQRTETKEVLLVP